MIPASE